MLFYEYFISLIVAHIFHSVCSCRTLKKVTKNEEEEYTKIHLHRIFNFTILIVTYRQKEQKKVYLLFISLLLLLFIFIIIFFIFFFAK